MASHPRKEIRAKVVELLTGTPDARPTQAEHRVYDSRDLPLNFDAMPAILVYTVGDEIDQSHNQQGRERRRILSLRIEAYDMGANAAEGVDAIAWEIEAIANASPTLSDMVESFRCQSTEIEFGETAGQDAMFVAVMEFEVIYWTHIVDNGTLPPLEIMLGFDPKTGPGNEPDYTNLSGEEFNV